MLKPYLKAVQAWIEQGCPNNAPFTVSCGLCRNTNRFLPGDYEGSEKLRMELEEAFMDEGLDPDYPFNSSEDNYTAESSFQTMWENPQRLAWVKKHAETLP